MVSAVNLALPAFFELRAEDAWSSIDFISDVHLRPEDPLTFKAWSDYLQRTRADAVFILGDLFEVWLGDDSLELEFEAQVVARLEEAAARLQLGFMVGNRDFLVGARLRQRVGFTALADPTRLIAWDHPVLLTHGDLLCTKDTEYQAFRQQVRSAGWQQEFLALPLAQRQEAARRMREGSMARAEARLNATGTAATDIDAATAVAWMHQAGCRSLVHGHTHRPGIEVLAPGYTRYVLSDWEVGAAWPRAEVLRLTRDGFARLPVSRA